MDSSNIGPSESRSKQPCGSVQLPVKPIPLAEGLRRAYPKNVIVQYISTPMLRSGRHVCQCVYFPSRTNASWTFWPYAFIRTLLAIAALLFAFYRGCTSWTAASSETCESRTSSLASVIEGSIFVLMGYCYYLRFKAVRKGRLVEIDEA